MMILSSNGFSFTFITTPVFAVFICLLLSNSLVAYSSVIGVVLFRLHSSDISTVTTTLLLSVVVLVLFLSDLYVEPSIFLNTNDVDIIKVVIDNNNVIMNINRPLATKNSINGDL